MPSSAKKRSWVRRGSSLAGSAWRWMGLVGMSAFATSCMDHTGPGGSAPATSDADNHLDTQTSFGIQVFVGPSATQTQHLLNPDLPVTGSIDSLPTSWPGPRPSTSTAYQPSPALAGVPKSDPWSAWLLVQAAAAECGVGVAPTDTTTFNQTLASNPAVVPTWAALPKGGGQAFALFSAPPDSCDDVLAQEQALVCTVDKLMGITTQVSSATFSGISQFSDGPSPGLSWTIPPQSETVKFIVRDLAVHLLANLAVIDMTRPTQAGTTLAGQTCVEMYGQAVQDPSFGQKHAPLLFGVSSGEMPTSFPPGTLAATVSGAPTLASQRLLFAAHILRIAGRQLNTNLTASSTSDVAQAQGVHSHQDDAVIGNTKAWGLDQPTAPQYNTLGHLSQVLFGRLEMGGGLPAPVCNGTQAANLTAFYGDDLTARVTTAAVATPSQENASKIVEQAGIALPTSFLASASGQTLRSLLTDQLIGVASAAVPNLDVSSTSIQSQVTQGIVSAIKDDDLQFALQRTNKIYQMRTNASDVPSPDFALPEASFVAPSIRQAGGTVVQGGLPSEGLFIAPSSSRTSGLAASAQCAEPTSSLTNPSLLFRQAFQSVSALSGVLYQRSMRVRQVASANNLTAPGQAGLVASGATAELKALGANRQTIVTRTNKELEVELIGWSATDLLTTDPNILSQKLAMVQGPPWVADCTMGSRLDCPQNFADSHIVRPTKVTVVLPGSVDQLNGQTLGADGPVVTATFPLPTTVPHPAATTSTPSPTLTNLSHFVLQGNPSRLVPSEQLLGSVDVGSFTAGQSKSASTSTAVRTAASGSSFSNGFSHAGNSRAPGGISWGTPVEDCLGSGQSTYIPLQNELTSNGSDPFESSWQYYLGQAQEAAATADMLAQQLMDVTVQQVMQSQSADEQLANVCGTYGALSDVSVDIHGTVTVQGDAALEECLNETPFDFVFLTAFPTATDKNPVTLQLLWDNAADQVQTLRLMLQCDGAGAANPTCTKLVPTATIVANNQTPPSSGTNSTTVYVGSLNQGPFTPNLIAAGSCGAFGTTAQTLTTQQGGFDSSSITSALSQSFLSPTTLSTALQNLRFLRDRTGNWSLSYGGVAIMDSHVGSGAWPGCLRASASGPASVCPPNADVFARLFMEQPGITATSSPATCAAGSTYVQGVNECLSNLNIPPLNSEAQELGWLMWRVEGALMLLGGMSGSIPESLFTIPIPVANLNAYYWSRFTGEPLYQPDEHIWLPTLAGDSVWVSQDGGITNFEQKDFCPYLGDYSDGPQPFTAPLDPDGVNDFGADPNSPVPGNYLGSYTPDWYYSAATDCGAFLPAVTTAYPFSAPNTGEVTLPSWSYANWQQSQGQNAISSVVAPEVPRWLRYADSGTGGYFLTDPVSWQGAAPSTASAPVSLPDTWIGTQLQEFGGLSCGQNFFGSPPGQASPTWSKAMYQVAQYKMPSLLFASSLGVPNAYPISTIPGVSLIPGSTPWPLYDFNPMYGANEFGSGQAGIFVGWSDPSIAMASPDAGVFLGLVPSNPALAGVTTSDPLDRLLGQADMAPNPTTVPWFNYPDSRFASLPADETMYTGGNPWNALWNPSLVSYSAREILFLNSYPPSGTCGAAATLVQALGLACVVSQDPVGSAGPNPPVVQSLDDLGSLASWMGSEAGRVRLLLSQLYLETVPARVVQDFNQGAVGTGSVSGSYGQAILLLEQDLQQIVQNMTNASNALAEAHDALNTAYLAIEASQITSTIQQGELELQVIQIHEQEALSIAAAVGSLGNAIGSLAVDPSKAVGSVSSAATSLAQAAITVGYGTQETNQINQLTILSMQQSNNSTLQALAALNQSAGQAYTNFANAFSGIQSATAASLAAAEQVAQAQSQGNYEAALGSGVDFVEIDGQPVSLPLNVVLNQEYSLDQSRYLQALTSARYLACVARLSIEQKLGVRLSSLTSSIGPLDAPSSWADDNQGAQGFQFADPSCNTGQSTGEAGQGGQSAITCQEVPKISAAKDPYIGDYVAKLQTFVDAYSVQYPFEEQDDTVILSFADDVLAQNAQCTRPSNNLLCFSSDFTRHQAHYLGVPPIVGWQSSPCGDASCVSAGVFTSATPAPAPPLQGDKGPGVSWLHEFTKPDFFPSQGGAAGAGGMAGSSGSVGGAGVAGGSAGSSGNSSASGGTGGANSTVPANLIYQAVSLAAGSYVFSWYDLSLSNEGQPGTVPQPYIVTIFDSSWTPLASNSLTAFVASGATTWSQRNSLGFAVASQGIYYVSFGTAPDQLTEDVALAAIQLEQAPSQNSPPSAYEGTDGSRLEVVGQGCQGAPKDVRSQFSHLCTTVNGNPACYYAFNNPIVLDFYQYELASGYLGASMSNFVYNFPHTSLESKFALGNNNYRHVSLALNLVGTGVNDCSNDASSLSCYGSAFQQFVLTHDASNVTILNPVNEEGTFQFGTQGIIDGKILTAEEFLTLPLSSSDASLISQPGFLRTELAGRPLDGTYTLLINDSPSLRWDLVQDVQLLINYRYWSYGTNH